MFTAELRMYLLLDDEIDKKIDITPILFLLVQNRQKIHGLTLIGSGANGLGIQVSLFDWRLT